MQLTFNNRMDQAKGGIYFEPDFRFGISQAAGFGMPNWYEGHQKRLKLDARVTFKIFEDCLANRHPVTGWQLTPRMNTTCFREGEEVANRRLDHELTLGFPKTVSVMGLVANDTRIITSFEAAAYQLLWLAARFAQTRVRQDQRNEVRLTHHLIGTLLPHLVSRAGDPHLHGHMPVCNLTWDPVEKRFKALEFSAVLHYIELLSRWASARVMTDLLAFGYELEIKSDSFEIAGVPADVISRFSKRTAAIEQAVAAKEKATGKKLSHAARKLTALSLRNEKQVEKWECLRRRWRIEAGDELILLDNLMTQAVRRSQAPRRSNPLKSARSALVVGAFSLCEKTVAVSHEEIVLQCLRSNIGLWTGDKLETAIKISQGNGAILPFPSTSKWTLPGTLRRLTSVIKTINAAKSSALPLIAHQNRATHIQPAIETLGASCDPMVLVSTTCSSDSKESLRAVIKYFGSSLQVTVPSAVRSARRFHFSEVLNSIEDARGGKVPVCLVAQAEKLTLSEFERVTSVAVKGSARVILMASRRALENSVDYRPLVAINRLSWLHCIPLTPTGRHQPQWIPAKAQTFASLATKLIRRDKSNVTLLRVKDNQMDSIATSAFALVSQFKDPADRLIAVDDVPRADALNEAIHRRFASAQPSHVVGLLSPTPHPPQPALAEILVSQKQTRHFSAGDILRVADSNCVNITVEWNDGRSKTVPRKVYSKLLPVRLSKLELHPGTHLELTEPYRPLSLKAGEIVRVTSVAPGGSIAIEGGCVFPPWFRFFRLGYCQLINNRLKSKPKAAMVVLSQKPTMLSEEAIRKLANATRGNIKIVAISPKALPQSILEKLRPNLAVKPPHLAEIAMETDIGASRNRTETLQEHQRFEVGIVANLSSFDKISVLPGRESRQNIGEKPPTTFVPTVETAPPSHKIITIETNLPPVSSPKPGQAQQSTIEML